jgi:hypothetical protein
VPTSLQLYFQQILPLAKCVAEDGRVVGHLLVDLTNTKPKDLAHAVREFANRTAMLRDCSFTHIGDMLAAMLAVTAHSDPAHEPREDVALDPASVTVGQAAAIGGLLAASARSSQVPATAVHRVMDSHSILRKMKSQNAWFAPMLEVLSEAADRPNTARRLTRRFSTTVTPKTIADDAPSPATFDSVVRPRPTLATS